MELWIRSQQKEMLFKVNSSLIIRHNENITNGVYFIECDKKKIAMYKTRKRALEVLDDIQNLFTKLEPVKTILNKDGLQLYLVQMNSIVFNMPEE